MLDSHDVVGLVRVPGVVLVKQAILASAPRSLLNENPKRRRDFVAHERTARAGRSRALIA